MSGRPAPTLAAMAEDNTDRPLADEQVRDELPAELNAHAVTEPYLFPNNNRRRIPAVLYLVFAALLVAVWSTVNSPLVNEGYLLAAGLLTITGLYSLAAGKNLAVDEGEALVAATADVGFAVGHASAQMGWRGWWSRPTWRILLYSAENPPTTRGLVFVDGVDGQVIDRIVEDNPEDWSDLLSRD